MFWYLHCVLVHGNRAAAGQNAMLEAMAHHFGTLFVAATSRSLRDALFLVTPVVLLKIVVNVAFAYFQGSRRDELTHRLLLDMARVTLYVFTGIAFQDNFVESMWRQFFPKDPPLPSGRKQVRGRAIVLGESRHEVEPSVPLDWDPRVVRAARCGRAHTHADVGARAGVRRAGAVELAHGRVRHDAADASAPAGRHALAPAAPQHRAAHDGVRREVRALIGTRSRLPLSPHRPARCSVQKRREQQEELFASYEAMRDAGEFTQALERYEKLAATYKRDLERGWRLFQDYATKLNEDQQQVLQTDESVRKFAHGLLHRGGVAPP